MALFWKHTALTAACSFMVAVSALLPFGAQAATDPCKANAKSTACKASLEKVAASKKAQTAATSTADKSKTLAKKTTVAKTVATSRTSTTVAKTAKPGAKSAAVTKTVTTKTARVQTSKTAKKVAGATSGKPTAVSVKTATTSTTDVASKEVVGGKTVTAKSKTRIVHRTRASAARQDDTVATQAAMRLGTPSAQAAALRSTVAYVQDLQTSTVLFAKNEDEVRPIASISKLMTALLVVDANQPMDEVLEVTDDDIDRLRHAASRLPVGSKLTRADMLHVALMSSENRAANALGRYYPGGMTAFVQAMNDKARELGMMDTHFVEPTGLSSDNVSSPRDLVRLLRAVSQRPLIHRYTTDTEYDVEMSKGRVQTFRNTNALVRNPNWDIKISKTGFINEAGECLVMLARIDGRDLAIVLLDSQGKYSRTGDAVRIRKFVQSEVAML